MAPTFRNAISIKLLDRQGTVFELVRISVYSLSIETGFRFGSGSSRLSEILEPHFLSFLVYSYLNIKKKNKNDIWSALFEICKDVSCHPDRKL